MEAIAVAAALLREQLPEVTLRPGAAMMARVASRGEHHGVIVLAGIPLKAQLPADVEAGATLRLKVEEVTPERVTLRVDPGVAPTPPPPPAAPPARARVAVAGAAGAPPRRRRRAGGRRLAGLPVAGARGAWTCGSSCGAGNCWRPSRPPPVSLLTRRRSGERLRANLERAGLTATVRVTPRHEPVDVYA